MVSSIRDMFRGLAAFWWGFLLLPVCGSQDLLDEKAHELQFHRSLAGFVLPFQIRWRFVIADQEGVPPDRQPTEAEYDGIRQATEDWFTVEIPVVYESATEFSFREVFCEVEDTEYNPSAEWVHEVLLGCQVVWDADALEDTPDVAKFLVDMNADYLLNNFVNPHLREAPPPNPPNIFRFSQRVGYITNDSGTSGPYAPGTTDAPVPSPETAAPTATTETTTPPKPPTPGPAQPGSPTPAPTQAKKIAPPAKCGSLASQNGRGGAAADAKGCESRLLSTVGIRGGKKRRLKGA